MGTSCRQQAPHPARQEIDLPSRSTARTPTPTTTSVKPWNTGNRSRGCTGPVGTTTCSRNRSAPIVSCTFAAAASELTCPPRVAASRTTGSSVRPVKGDDDSADMAVPPACHGGPVARSPVRGEDRTPHGRQQGPARGLPVRPKEFVRAGGVRPLRWDHGARNPTPPPAEYDGRRPGFTTGTAGPAGRPDRPRPPGPGGRGVV